MTSEFVEAAPDEAAFPAPPLAQWSAAVRRLAAVLPVQDWTGRASSALPSPSETISSLEWELAAILFRSERGHPLLVGPPGIGKTYAVQEFARRVGAGAFPNLADRRFLHIDGRHIGPSDSRACLELIFAAISAESSLIVCLDGLAGLLRRSNGESNRPLLCSLLDRASIRVIGIVNPWDYADLIASDAELLRYFARVEMTEPSEVETVTMVDARAREFAATDRLSIKPETIPWLVQATSSFLLSEHHPAKDLQVLREACERKVFDRDVRLVAKDSLEAADLAAVISDRTGIPAETILGRGGEADFEELLTTAVVGQPRAVEMVARELRLIQAGLTATDKPASVMLFAGLTGVGKTELAKRVAEIYSSSHRLQVYPMGNFTEPHSVSGIMGVPPGYVGHEQGGRIVNDLNADPYSVFLLDEAEKCHPNIWKPFLNLFDEGWIIDQRGVKARADRAIFILTTNAGDRHLSQLADSGRSDEDVAEAVRQTLSRIRLERSSQPVFPAQFLSRIRRIVVFRPLDADAMIGIAQRCGQRLKDQWQRKRSVELQIANEVWQAIGMLAHQVNQSHQQQEGGRMVQKLIDQIVQDRLQRFTLETPALVRPGHAIQIELSADAPSIDSSAALDAHLHLKLVVNNG